MMAGGRGSSAGCVRRAEHVQWLAVDCVLVLLFSLDLWWSCPGHRSALHWVEGAAACVAAAAGALHAVRLLRARAPPPAPRAPAPARPPPTPDAASLSPPRRWRAPPPAVPEPAPSPSPQHPPDTLIADLAQLDRYLERAREAECESAWCGAGSPPPPPPYRVSPLRGEQARSAPAEPWRPVRPEPARLARLALALRRWLHATLLEPLARELAAAEAAGAESARLQPFLRPFADREYAARRVRELARGGVLAAYRWDGGGAARDPARHPPDAELLARLLAAYLDAAAPAAAARAWSAAHVAWDGPVAREDGALRLHRVRAAPPHFVVAVGRAVLEPAPGRDNLLLAALLLLLAAARRDPPALNLGPHGLNLLWVLDC